MTEDREDAIFIGCTGYQPHGQAALREGSMMEIQESFVAPPRSATLQRWRAMAPEGFAFAVRCWLVVTHGAESPAWARVPKAHGFAAEDCGFFRQTQAVQQAYEAVLKAAEAIEARVVLFDTPAAFTPTAENRRRLVEFFERSPRPDNVAFAWEARGVWSPTEVGAICEDVGLIPAVDPVAAEWWPKGPAAYLRLAGARYGEVELATIAEGLARYQPAYCVLANPTPFPDLRRLVAECAET